MELAARRARELIRERNMEKQLFAGREQESAIAADRPLIIPRGLVKRMKNAISINIGLYEIRVNLFLWDLFRMARQREN